jgi:hypothetical protein
MLETKNGLDSGDAVGRGIVGTEGGMGIVGRGGCALAAKYGKRNALMYIRLDKNKS